MIKFITKQLSIVSSFERATIDDMIEYLSKLEYIGLDTETEGFDPHTCKILSLQLGDNNTQYVIDFQTLSKDEIYKIKKILESGKLIIMHNAQFDLRFLYKLDIDIKNIYDTFLAELILTTGYEHRDKNDQFYAGTNLKYIVNKYIGTTLNKEIRGKINYLGLTDEVIKYGAEDIKYLGIIMYSQLKQIKAHSLEKVLELENTVVRVFAKMTFKGVRLDANKWLSVAKLTEENTINLAKELDTLVLNEPKLSKFIPEGYQQNLFGFEERKIDINWGSPQQKLEILNELGFNVDSVNERTLLKNKNRHIIVSKLLEFSKQAKLANAFGKDFVKHINKQTGRIHMTVWQILATGRIATSEPNLNQIPSKGDLAKKIRAAFIPKDGYKIVGGDYSSFELAIIAEFSKDPLWIKTLKDNKNLHSELCAATFNIPIEDVEKPFPQKPEITYRDLQKTIDFGLSYGMSEFKLADTMQVEVSEAKKIINRFFSVVPEVETFLNLLGNFGKRNGYIRTAKPFERKRWFPQWNELQKNPKHPDKFKWLGSIERKSKNTPIQGSNGDVIKLALVRVQEEIDKNNWPVNILLSIYDEIQTECREDKAVEWKATLEKIMIDAAKEIIKTVPIKADCKITDYWKK